MPSNCKFILDKDSNQHIFSKLRNNKYTIVENAFLNSSNNFLKFSMFKEHLKEAIRREQNNQRSRTIIECNRVSSCCLEIQLGKGEEGNQFTICRIDATRVLYKKWRAAGPRTGLKGQGRRRKASEFEACSHGNRNHILNFHKRVRWASFLSLRSSAFLASYFLLLFLYLHPLVFYFCFFFSPLPDPPTGEKMSLSFEQLEAS